MGTQGGWLGRIVDFLEKLEVQVRGLVTSQTVEAKEFVVLDNRGENRAPLVLRPSREGTPEDRSAEGRLPFDSGRAAGHPAWSGSEMFLLAVDTYTSRGRGGVSRLERFLSET